jgi:hypothetical protein
MPSKTKAIAPIGETLPTDSPLPPSSILQSAIDQQEAELTNLQTQMDRLSDEYATRARSIVLQGLEDGRQKARAQILTIDIPSFFGSEVNGSPLPSPKSAIALLPSIKGETEC